MSGIGPRSFLAANLVFMGVLLGVPLGVLVLRSFDFGSSRFWSHYTDLGSARRGSVLFVPPIDAVRNSLMFALGATVIAFVIGGLASLAIAGTGSRLTRGARWLDLALMIPLGVSAVTVGFGFLIALDHPPLDFRDSLWLVPLAHALVAVPFVIRAMVPALRSIDPSVRDAAAVLGASPSRAWIEVDLPIVSRAATTAAGLRLRRIARRVRRHRVPVRDPDRLAHAADRDLSLPRPARARRTSAMRWHCPRS